MKIWQSVFGFVCFSQNNNGVEIKNHKTSTSVLASKLTFGPRHLAQFLFMEGELLLLEPKVVTDY